MTGTTPLPHLPRREPDSHRLVQPAGGHAGEARAHAPAKRRRGHARGPRARLRGRADRPGARRRHRLRRDPPRPCARCTRSTGRARCAARTTSRARSTRPRTSYYKFEGNNTSGSHKLNSALAQAHYAAAQGLTTITTETARGSGAPRLAEAAAHYGLDLDVFMVKCSFEQKPFRRNIMETFGATVTPSPSDTTEAGRRILAAHPRLLRLARHRHLRGRGAGPPRAGEPRPLPARQRPQPGATTATSRPWPCARRRSSRRASGSPSSRPSCRRPRAPTPSSWPCARPRGAARPARPRPSSLASRERATSTWSPTTDTTAARWRTTSPPTRSSRPASPRFRTSGNPVAPDARREGPAAARPSRPRRAQAVAESEAMALPSPAALRHWGLWHARREATCESLRPRCGIWAHGRAIPATAPNPATLPRRRLPQPRNPQRSPAAGCHSPESRNAAGPRAGARREKGPTVPGTAGHGRAISARPLRAVLPTELDHSGSSSGSDPASLVKSSFRQL